MGFKQTAISYTGYEVLAAPGPDLKEAVVDGLIRGRVFPIDIDAGRDRTAGFAVFDDPLDLDFTNEKVLFDPLIVFSFRTDRLTVPSSTLKLYIRKRVNENLAATRRQKMPKQEREELAEMVKHELLRKAIPAIQSYDVVWDTSSGRLRIFTTSAAVLEDFATRARELLGLELRPLNTVGILESRLDERELHEAYHLLPATFLSMGAAAVRDGEDD